MRLDSRRAPSGQALVSDQAAARLDPPGFDPSRVAALHVAGAALRSLNMGAVRLRYRPADHLITRDTFSLWLEDDPGLNVGCGDTPEAALFDALAKRNETRKAA